MYLANQELSPTRNYCFDSLDMHLSHGGGVEYLSQKQVKWPPTTMRTNSQFIFTAGSLSTRIVPYTAILSQMADQRQGRRRRWQKRMHAIPLLLHMCKLKISNLMWNTTELSSYLPSDFLFNNPGKNCFQTPLT